MSSGDNPAKAHGLVADVLMPVALDIAYSYAVPPGLALAPGVFVEAPLGPRLAVGVVWEVRPGPGSPGNLKSIRSRLDIPPLNESLRQLIDWVARWSMSPRGMVLRMAVRAPFHAAPEPVRVGVRLAGPTPRRMTPAREKVLAVAEGRGVFIKSALAKAAGCSASVIDGLIDEGVLETLTLPPEPVAPRSDPHFAAPSLSPDQSEAALQLESSVRSGSFSVTLLEGVTGSGKTEVYFEAIAAALDMDRQILVLMPEIALTTQFIDRFQARFGARPAEWHSGVSAARRARIWSAVAAGEAQIVIGARSALFLPFNALGLIIVDEEHDSAYKQEDGVIYHARDMAVVRGRIEGAAVILASATPSIESRVNAGQGRYQHVKLNGRFEGRAMPVIEAVDMRLKAPARGKWISPRLAAALSETLLWREQSLLFLNRRGYAPLTLCRSCGHRFQCPNCTTWLVEHRFRKALACHHCGHIERRPDLCPNCEAADSLMACGPGIERLAEEVGELLPDARVMVLSSDLPGGAERLRQEFEAVAAGECDIIIGTQMVAKGHNFPLLSLVGVIDADIGLTSGDPRAAERTFQLLQQVTGRAGRFETAGRALVQSFQPEHPVMRAILSGDSERFYAEETEQRRRAGLPPFGRLAALIISGDGSASTENFARAIARTAFELPLSPTWTLAPAGGLPGENEISLLGPAEAPIAVIRGRHRFRLLVRAPRSADLQGFLRALLAAGPKERGGIRVTIDIDPQSFL
ncbi:primosomal protein N' [Methylocella tundrae]|uniref:Replication restart protein PriA n=1 Tax=Methylocella tundrae TaxID=227605 RepID=A0A4U8Z3A8_METTU|nr:primosomal protein N' [Methylocella tundrae]WPP03765.1 primosomal protein N' [Methylocella tundrae]VFU09924.1 Primosomal protein N' [Methylocella tundrae]